MDEVEPRKAKARNAEERVDQNWLIKYLQCRRGGSNIGVESLDFSFKYPSNEMVIYDMNNICCA
mgnify:CR=1 FL=1